MQAAQILEIVRLGFPWQTVDPFLFCAYHDDAYPAGNERMGPAASLAGRDIGQDFAGIDGWRMYHGAVVPGFPAHPHRGFETVTLVRKGLLDHSDSLGATARFGGGDVQWLTAGRGIVHAEMFPLVDRDATNPLELFQVWLNLPRSNKMAEPYFTMRWAEDIPTETFEDEAGRKTAVTIVAGRLADREPVAPPPDSWAARADSDVAIWTLRLDAQATWTLPAARTGTNRMLYYFRGSGLILAGREVPLNSGIALQGDLGVKLEAGPEPCELLLLQGRPIEEPVAQYGPFVMNTEAEIHQAFADYRRTQFGGWPWPTEGPVHPRDSGRFARHPDGKTTRPAGT
jgi:redox-sensitive bicupin YhaK (pirin superfamily)